MGTRVPVPRYNPRPASSFVAGSSPTDLSAVGCSSGELESISDVDRDAITEANLDNGEGSASVDGMRDSYSNSFPVNGVEMEDDRSGLENSGESSRFPSTAVSIDDVTPIETARVRFLQVVVDHFVYEHVVEVGQTYDDEYNAGYEKVNKRKPREVQYEGDSRFALPLMYVANLYETLVNEVNARLALSEGIHGKTIGVALEAAGGLYRRLAKKFPRKGPCSFKRRELATSLETRSRFPELVREEKRVRFVVVNGLAIVERPRTIPIEDAEWFKRLTGRQEAAISERDYKFYSPRHKYRRVPSETASSLPEIPQSQLLPTMKNHGQLMQQIPFHPTRQPHQQPGPHFPPIVEIQHQPGPALSQHVACFQSLAGGHVAGRLHVLPSGPAKFCDECGAPYLRETSKFCSECGVKRLGI